MQDIIKNSIKKVSKLPSLGQRSAMKIVLSLVQNKEKQLPELIQTLNELKDNIKVCKACGNFDADETCAICQNPLRDKQTLCVLSDVASLMAMEKASVFKGLYHITGGLLSAIEGIEPEDLNIKSVVDRCLENDIKEIIFALPTTMDGRITQNYIINLLKENAGCESIVITELAQGVPIGGEIDYLDEGTIMQALKSRKST